MKFVWLFFLIFFSPCAFSQEKSTHYHLIDIEYFDMKYQQFDYARDPYAPQYDGEWAYRASSDFRLNVMESFYWDNNVHTEALKSGGVKTVGWHWEAGAHLTDSFDCFHEHHSRHIMEGGGTSPTGKNIYPLEDSYGCRLKFVDRPHGRSFGGWLSP